MAKNLKLKLCQQGARLRIPIKLHFLVVANSPRKDNTPKNTGSNHKLAAITITICICRFEYHGVQYDQKKLCLYKQ